MTATGFRLPSFAIMAVCIGQVSHTVLAQCDLLVPDTYDTIQQAIDAAVDGQTVCVAAGTYYESINFVGKAITVRGMEGPQSTVIDGSVSGRVVTFQSGESGDSVLQGFSIMHGHVDCGGILIEAASPRIVDCLLTDNGPTAGITKYGGAVGVFGMSAPLFVDCHFTRNSTTLTDSSEGGALYSNSSTPTFENCAFQDNIALHGGAVCAVAGSVIWANGCSFVGNSAGTTPGASHGGAIYARDSQMQLLNCTIESNEAYVGGGIMNHNTTSQLIECRLIANHATSAGAVHEQAGGSLSATNCVFTGNTASEGGGAVNVGAVSEIVLERCTLDDNAASYGGALLATQTGHVLIHTCRFLMNTAINPGGALLIQDSISVDIGRSEFCENTPDHISGVWNDLGGNEFSDWCSCLSLSVENLVHGQTATFTVCNGIPGRDCAILWSMREGSYEVNNGTWCALFDFWVPTHDPYGQVVVNGRFDDTGVFTAKVRVPNGATGLNVCLQAAMSKTCPDTCMSNKWCGAVQ